MQRAYRFYLPQHLAHDGRVPGVPVEASVSLKLKNSDDFGCVLTTENLVMVEGLYGTDEPWKVWIKDNLKAFESHMAKRNIIKYGLFIVTKTYSTKTATITIKAGRSWEGKVGISAKLPAVGELGPNVAWSNATNNEACFKYESGEGDSRVVFVEGFYFTLNWFNYVRRELKLKCIMMLILTIRSEVQVEDAYQKPQNHRISPSN